MTPASLREMKDTIVEILDRLPAEKALHTSMIHKALPSPKPAHWRLSMILREMVAEDEIDFTFKGTRRIFRSKKPLAEEVSSSYNSPAKSESLLPSTEFDSLASTLYRLTQGRTVHLQFDDPTLKVKHYKGHGKRLVLLIPGMAIGLARETLLVTVSGKGNAFIRPGDPGNKPANLVLAGLPARLAGPLINALYQVFNER